MDEPPNYLNDGCGCCSSSDLLYKVIKKRQRKDGVWVLTVVVTKQSYD